MIEGVHEPQALIEVALRHRVPGRYRIREIAKRGKQRRGVARIFPGSIGQQPRELHPSLERRVAFLRRHAAYGREQVRGHGLRVRGLCYRRGQRRPLALLHWLGQSAVIVKGRNRERGQAQTGSVS